MILPNNLNEATPEQLIVFLAVIDGSLPPPVEPTGAVNPDDSEMLNPDSSTAYNPS